MLNGRATVAEAHMAVRLIDAERSSVVKELHIEADSNNSGPVFVGAASVLAAAGGENSLPLQPGDRMPVILDIDPSDLWVNAPSDGQSIMWFGN